MCVFVVFVVFRLRVLTQLQKRPSSKAGPGVGVFPPGGGRVSLVDLWKVSKKAIVEAEARR